MSKKDGSVKTKRSNAWIRLRKRLSRKGVVEVDVDHHRYKLLNRLRHGISDLMLNHKELGPKKELGTEDYNHVSVEEYKTPGGRKYTFTSYSSCVFASLRKAVNVSEEHYLNAIAPPDLPYMEFMSNSRSGQDFYLSNNQEYIIKTDTKHNIDIFRSFLLEYLDHFQLFPHSLIVKFLGVYALEGPSLPKIHFLVMQNIFFPPTRIETRFDIKGCLKNRYQKPNPPESNIITVLKDQNFQRETIDLGIQKKWFLRQLKIDVDFLCQVGVQDYSLLLGRHKLADIDTQNKVGDLFVRVQKSYNITGELPHQPTDNKKADTHLEVIHERRQSIPGEVEEPVRMETVGKENHRRRIYTVPEFLKDPGNGDLSQLSNRRLLLNCRNPLHVINGEDCRYYMGIVDFFTQYECRQKFARIIKTVKFFSSDHSTVPPDVYSERFLKFISQRTTGS